MMTSQMKVTAILPLFEKGPWIARALTSLHAQTLPDFQAIVVDDGSTDGGPEVVRRWPDPRVRLVTIPHSGAGAARNCGLAEAQTPWVAFLDADDEWHPQFLERTLRAAETSPRAVGAFSNLALSTGGVLLGDVPTRDGIVTDYFHVLLENEGMGMSASSSVVRRDVLLAAGGFAEGVARGEDSDAWARLAWSGPLAYVPEALAVYHRGTPGSITTAAENHQPPFPPLVQSYRTWAAAGRIPPALDLSTRRFVRFTRNFSERTICSTSGMKTARLRRKLSSPENVRSSA